MIDLELPLCTKGHRVELEYLVRSVESEKPKVRAAVILHRAKCPECNEVGTTPMIDAGNDLAVQRAIQREMDNLPISAIRG